MTPEAVDLAYEAVVAGGHGFFEPLHGEQEHLLRLVVALQLTPQHADLVVPQAQGGSQHVDFRCLLCGRVFHLVRLGGWAWE